MEGNYTRFGKKAFPSSYIPPGTITM